MASFGWPQRRAGFDADSAALMGVAPLDFQKITCPTLIMHGTADRAVPPETYGTLTPASRFELYWMRGSHVSFFREEGDTAQPYALEWLQRQVRNGLGP
ncbi:alpha/beta fold hydrolase [Arthrobacter pascens]|uniref:alpha/beta fold hydrolase n=1 Tax=Arthrobacter pascens TaxID=1677 RepID=UPI0027D8D7F5|nr:alpha/beta hydrolase [Arthrobacter pascens]